MSEWNEKAEEKRLRYEAAIEEKRAACEAYTLADNAHRLVECRLRGEVYGDGTLWTSEQDPRIMARTIELPELVESLSAVKAAYIRMNSADAALMIATPRHWLVGD